MERYDNYKDSGVDWIGQIPEHWASTSIKNVLISRQAGSWGEEPTSNKFNTTCLRIADFDYKKLQFEIKSDYTQRAYDFNEVQTKMLHKGNLLIEKSGGGDKTPVGRVVLYNLDLEYPMYANFMERLVVNDKFVLPSLMNYLFASLFSHGIVWKYIKAATGIQNLNISEYFSKEKVFLPPLSEQQAIAAYLDEETGKLDAAVEKLERMVEVLKERKQLIISKAVTRGLDDSAPLKDSGLEWIGQIPEHWSINRFKAIFTLNTGISFTKADLVETGQPVISYGQVHSKLNQVAKANLSLIKYIPQSLTTGKQKSYCLPNDFIFADTSEDFEGCGNNFYNDSELSVFAGSHTILAKLRCNIEGKYLAYLFSTSLWRQQIRSRVNGVKVFSITQSILKATSVILPPIAEQQAIAAYLDEKVGKLDEAIEKQLRMIELLKERKQILISDVVTGKIKVA